MAINNLLSLLSKVKKIGRDKWHARCPAHDDSGPSLALRELDDGRILIHCFAGCSNSEVLQSLGLGFSDLYPDTASTHLPPVRKPWNANDVLHSLAFEILLAWNFAMMLANGAAMSDADRNRLLLSASRMQRGLEVING